METPSVFRLAPSEVFLTSLHLDYTIVAVDESSDVVSLSQWAPLVMNHNAPVFLGDLVYIIQHPAAGPKKIAIGTNAVVGRWDPRIFYLTDTLPGSSGSPVLNENWEVIALHHAGGNVVVSPRNDRRYVNEGILISQIRIDLGSDWPLYPH
jgi:endonuclease G